MLSTTASEVERPAYPFQESQFLEAINKATLDFMFSPLSLGEKREVLLKPKFETACWSYLPPHRIFIGQDLFKKEFVLSGLDETQQSKYIENHFHHEMGHALFTLRDFAKMTAELKKIGASFQTWNLFEDALIEHRYRVEASYRFDWLAFEQLGVGFRPDALFFCVIQAEGDFERVWELLSQRVEDGWADELSLSFPIQLNQAGETADDALTALKHWLSRVEYYFQKAIRCRKSLDLLPVIKEWLIEFGEPSQDESAGSSSGSGNSSSGGSSSGESSSGESSPGKEGRLEDLELGAKLQQDAEFLAQFMDDATSVSTSEKKAPKVDKPERDSNCTAVAGNANILAPSGFTSINRAHLAQITSTLEKWFVARTRFDSTEVPTRRPSARHFAIGTPRYRTKSKKGRSAKNIVLVVDLSGSMNFNNGFHIEEGRLLIAALSALAKKGFVSGHVVFSGVYDCNPIYETYPFPLDEEVINRADARYEAEGLGASIEANMKLCQAADLVLVYTDGQITDIPIDKARLHAKGIKTVGLYAGDDLRFLSDLLGYFDKAILRSNAFELADAIVAQLK